MARTLIPSGSSFEEEIGDSRAVVQGDWVIVSGTTGFDCASMTIADVVRVTCVLPDASEFPKCWTALRRVSGAVRPAAMMISAGLADARMKIEIEATALKQPR